MKNIILAITLLFGITILHAQQSKPYKDNQDARADLKTAIAQAQKENKNILVQFGGNWCPWCRSFHALVTRVPRLDSLMKASYVYLLISVPIEREKRDYSLFREFENPNRFGYPVFVILDRNGKRLNTMDSDGLDPNPKGITYDTTKVENFLKLWTVEALDPKTYQQK